MTIAVAIIVLGILIILFFCSNSRNWPWRRRHHPLYWAKSFVGRCKRKQIVRPFYSVRDSRRWSETSFGLPPLARSTTVQELPAPDVCSAELPESSRLDGEDGSLWAKTFAIHAPGELSGIEPVAARTLRRACSTDDLRFQQLGRPRAGEIHKRSNSLDMTRSEWT